MRSTLAVALVVAMCGAAPRLRRLPHRPPVPPIRAPRQDRVPIANAQGEQIDVYGPSPIAQPAAPTPSAGAALATGPGAFSWAPSAGATSYNVYLDGTLVQTSAATTYTPAAPIAAGEAPSMGNESTSVGPVLPR